MAELPTQSIWVPRLIRLIVIALCSSCTTCENADNSDRQFIEMKTLVSQLDSKISSIDSKLSNLNVLEYAFKMNTIDNSIRMLNTRVDQITSQMDSIKESLKTLSSSPCQQLERAQSPQQARSPPTEADSGVNLVLKLDDYGKKLVQFHKDNKAALEEHHQSLTAFFEVVRSGFTKVISKVDSLLALEGQMSTIVPLVRQLSASTNLISDEVPNIVMDISEIKRGVANLESANKALAEIATQAQSSVSFPASQLEEAVEEAKGLRLEMVRLNSVEEKVVKAAFLSSGLLAKESLNSLPAEDREIAQNLTKSLSEIENVMTPLFLSLTYNFEHIQAIISDAFATLANRTQCRSDESVKLEIIKLKESIAKQSLDKTSNSADVLVGKASKPTDVFSYCRDTIQDLLVNETPDLKMPLLKLISHLKILADVNENAHGSQLDSQNWDKPLRTLLG